MTKREYKEAAANRRAKILETVQRRPGATREDLMSILGCTYDETTNAIEFLGRQGLIATTFVPKFINDRRSGGLSARVFLATDTANIQALGDKPYRVTRDAPKTIAGSFSDMLLAKALRQDSAVAAARRLADRIESSYEHCIGA